MDRNIIEDIDADYYECLGEYANLNIVLNKISNKEAAVSDSFDEQKVKQAQINGALINLGRIGELAFKYLLKLKQIQLFPNQNYDQFSNNERIYKNGVVRSLVDRRIISEDDAQEIISFTDSNNQKFHNFMFLELVVKKVMPDVYNNFRILLDYSFTGMVIEDYLAKSGYSRSKIIASYYFDDSFSRREIIESYFSGNPYSDKLKEDEKMSSDTALEFLKMAIWPDVMNYYNIHDYSEDVIDIEPIVIQKSKKIIQTAKENGDIFTRLRYYSNQLNSIPPSIIELKDVNTYINVLISYIKAIHDYGLTVNPTFVHARNQAIRMHRLIGRTEDSINTIFTKYANWDEFDIEEIMFSSYKIDNNTDEVNELLELFNQYKVPISRDFMEIILSGIRPNTIKTFFDNSITNFHDIYDILFDEIGIKDNHEIFRLINEYKLKAKSSNI